ncbi:hypothetical protein [Acetobacter nitrogenifigens]|uniref:hypothetical protein n=1 Tax=Acetobacter nitrogenifigens TaxID=285268 RepID=UPI00047B6B24|nr:hypothetical protein [Acetobacter nitrogenifigens]
MISLARKPEISHIEYHLASTYFLNAIEYLKKCSKNACGIISYVETSDIEINVLVVRDQDSGFYPYKNDLQIPPPCIVWAANRSLTIFGKRENSRGLVDADYSPEIGLLHELGHAKQFIEDRGYRLGRKIGQKQPWFPLNASSLNDQQNADVEADNLRRHEHPVCQDLGLVIRNNYQNFRGTSDFNLRTAGALYLGNRA